jgi:hypothetical protein
MSGAVKCIGCGATNLLPEGKSSMLCKFCGNAIEQIVPNNHEKEKKRDLSAAAIVGDRLAYRGREIESLDEIIELYADSELDCVDDLDLSNNKIKTLKGLSKFRATKIDFSNNEIEYIDELPVFYEISSFDTPTYIKLLFSNNLNLKGFTADVISFINCYDGNFSSIYFKFQGCPNFDYNSLLKINFKKILEKKYTGTVMFSEMDSNIDLPVSLKEFGFTKHAVTNNPSKSNWYYELNNKPTEEVKANTGKCFIATATMGSYEHPIVIELRRFRDNWILQKTWGKDFIEWYYHYGAKAAKFIEKSFILRKVCYLLIIKPLVSLSRVINNTKNKT